MSIISKDFVTFFSPGTFVSEDRTIELPPGLSLQQKISKAVELVDGIVERHGATPYGFRLLTRSRGENDLDSKETFRSGTYYLGGRIETLEQVEARNDPKESILRSNMRTNEWNKIIINDNSWRYHGIFDDKKDVLLPYFPQKKVA